MESSVLTRPDRATVGPANDGEPDEPVGVTIDELATHVKGQFDLGRMALLVEGINGDQIWQMTEQYHVTLHDVTRAVIPRLCQQDAMEAAGKDPNTWKRPERVIQLALPLQKLLCRNLAARKMKIGEARAEGVVMTAVMHFLEQSEIAERKAQADRLKPKPAPTPPPKTDFVARAEAINVAVANAEAAEQQQAMEALQVRYLAVLARFRNPSETDIAELASLLTEMPIDPERVRKDIDLIKNAVRLQAAYSKPLRWLHKLNALRGNATATDGELLASDDYESREGRTARTELTKLAKERPLFFDMKVSPPTLRFPPDE